MRLLKHYFNEAKWIISASILVIIINIVCGILSTVGVLETNDFFQFTNNADVIEVEFTIGPLLIVNKIALFLILNAFVKVKLSFTEGYSTNYMYSLPITKKSIVDSDFMMLVVTYIIGLVQVLTYYIYASEMDYLIIVIVLIMISFIYSNIMLILNAFNINSKLVIFITLFSLFFISTFIVVLFMAFSKVEMFTLLAILIILSVVSYIYLRSTANTRDLIQ